MDILNKGILVTSIENQAEINVGSDIYVEFDSIILKIKMPLIPSKENKQVCSNLRKLGEDLINIGTINDI